MLFLFFIIVRLCENKLDLIKQALDSSPTAYKKYDKVKNNILKIILIPLSPSVVVQVVILAWS